MKKIKEFRLPKKIAEPMRLLRKWARAGIKNEPPRLVFTKWWYKFIPSKRKQLFFINWWFAKEWKNGLWKKYMKKLREQLLYGKN